MLLQRSVVTAIISLLALGSRGRTRELWNVCPLPPGGRHSLECTLILTEGDSAKSLAVSGLGVIGRDRYGVFPLRGKILNVREASHKQVRICARARGT